MTTIDLERFNPFDAVIQQCPFPHYAAMREQVPVFHVASTDLYMVTRHDLVVPILRDTETFSNDFGQPGEVATGPVVDELRAIAAEGWPRVATMLTVDPPWHTRYRSTVAPFFTPKRIAALRAVVQEITERLLDGWGPSGTIELVAALAVPLPIEAIAAVLDVPTDRLADFKRWSDDSIASIGAQISDERRLEAQRGIVELQHFFAPRLEAERASSPSGTLMSELAHAEIDDGEGGRRRLEMAEMLSILAQLLVAGNETTTKSLTEGVMLLAANPEQFEALRADPAGRAGPLTEEVLRLSTPTQGMFRKVQRDTEIEGVPIPAGARLVVMYAAANRDPAVFADPDRFDPERPNHKDHLAFGKGIHFCLGAPLSRLELQVAYEALGRRLTRLELAPTNTYAYAPSFMLRGLERLEVTFEQEVPA